MSSCCVARVSSAVWAPSLVIWSVCLMLVAASSAIWVSRFCTRLSISDLWFIGFFLSGWLVVTVRVFWVCARAFPVLF